MYSLEQVQKELLLYVPEFYDNIKEADNLVNTIMATELQKLYTKGQELQDYVDPKTTPMEGLERFFTDLELYKYFDYPPTDQEKRAIITVVLSAWKKFNSTSIKNLTKAYTGGKVKVEFIAEESKIKISFTDLLGVPPNLKALERVFRERMPAHLIYQIILLYITWEMFDRYDYMWSKWDSLDLTWEKWEEYAITE